MNSQQGFFGHNSGIRRIPGSGDLRSSLRIEPASASASVPHISTPQGNRDRIVKTQISGGSRPVFSEYASLIHAPSKKNRCFLRRILGRRSRQSKFFEPEKTLLNGDPSKLPTFEQRVRCHDSDHPLRKNPVEPEINSPVAPVVTVIPPTPVPSPPASFPNLAVGESWRLLWEAERKKLFAARRKVRMLERRDEKVQELLLAVQRERATTMALGKHHKWLYEREAAKVKALTQELEAKQTGVSNPEGVLIANPLADQGSILASTDNSMAPSSIISDESTHTLGAPNMLLTLPLFSPLVVEQLNTLPIICKEENHVALESPTHVTIEDGTVPAQPSDSHVMAHQTQPQQADDDMQILEDFLSPAMSTRVFEEEFTEDNDGIYLTLPLAPSPKATNYETVDAALFTTDQGPELELITLF